MAIKIEYAIQEAVTNMRRNFFMTAAAVMVVMVSLLQFGGVFLLRGAVTKSVELVNRQVEVAVFLTKDISADQRTTLQHDLTQIPEVKSVIYESKDQAYVRFKRLFANQPEIVKNTDPSALPESFRVKLRDPKQFEIIKDRIQGRPGVDTIRDERNTVKQLFSVTGKLSTAALWMALLVGLAASVLIATTIRMAIFARRKEIEIMKLVGATNWFIRIPFMLEGMVQGLIGAAIASLALLPLKTVLSSFGPGGPAPLRLDITYGDIGIQAMYLLVAGVVVGAAGSMVGLRRFLDI